MPPNYSSPRDARAQAAADRAAGKAYQKASRKWYQKKRFILPLALVALIILFSLLNPNNSSSGTGTPGTPAGGTSAPAAQPAEAPAAEEPAMEVTADQLIKDLDANALKASNTYKGKRVKVTGYVSNIDAQGDYFSLRGEDKFSFKSVRMDIGDEHLTTVQGWETDQKVTATGTITDVGEVLGYSVRVESLD